MVSGGGITKDRLLKSEVDSCGVCSLRVNANSVLCVQCGRWIHGRCARVKRFSFQEFLHAENVMGILERQWIRKKGYVRKWKEQGNW